MTALSATTEPGTRPTAPPAARHTGPGGLFRALSRTHRTALLLSGLALTAVAAALVWLHSLGDEARAGVSACATPPADGLPSCAAVDAITADEIYSTGLSVIATVLSWALFPVAAWAGGTLIGRELEQGTAQLAWTQSVGPLRWLAAKLALPAALLTAGTSGLVLLNLWARGDGDPDLAGDWYEADVFVSTGPTAVAYVLAGLALGALAGLVWRRALPAAGVALGASLLLHSFLERHREDLWPTITRIAPNSIELPRSAYQVSWNTPAPNGAQTTHTTFHPQSHFWPLQYVETGLLLALAAAATATAFVVLARRLP
ncbi:MULTISPECIES: hypothetical protein [Streptomyces]|uniref:ABC transporter permease n=1 Tax=Streptomyces koelreuteriae TaxID=2838015 RepID=A0ABX8FUA9_9ACTN|nr:MULTISPECIES: hypothetical protein [Streptomyces]QWB24697.1 hypothetical protein KJK29_20125 [Streptomyces koelreuteriae]UUA07709.1 hypothetical protein NNW98_20240 [Streptomyces koelreuteriae]UUA15338.1 hypothetical protein NNW99_20235 [Streptomyces sp. CRCS-T-1]